jgi:hypothetical protein
MQHKKQLDVKVINNWTNFPISKIAKYLVLFSPKLIYLSSFVPDVKFTSKDNDGYHREANP